VSRKRIVAYKQLCSITLDSSLLCCEIAEQRIHWIPREGKSPSFYKSITIPYTLRAYREQVEYTILYIISINIII
jgi:hypothetical protein